MKIAIGMMVRNFDSEEVLSLFLDNAIEYNHEISRVIVAYSHGFSVEAAKRIEERIPVSFVKLNHNERMREILMDMQVPAAAVEELTHCKLLEEHELVPYGFNRNTVLMEALFSDIDTLIFIDSDVYPYVLKKNEQTGVVERETYDFFGQHIKGLSSGVDITSSDYSGYNILPPANFPGMDILLRGLGKEVMTDFWAQSMEHHSLLFQNNNQPVAVPTTKVLGGNLGIRMDAVANLPPFFSGYYFYDGKPYLARGEDTLMGILAREDAISCLDIDLHIFHNTYGTYPQIPDLCRDVAVKNRLFYACSGWIGRNAFFKWMKQENSVRAQEKTYWCLKTGGRELARYTGDARFLALGDLHRAAIDGLPEMIQQYKRIEEAWGLFVEGRYAA